MDELAWYRDILQAIVHQYAQFTPSHGQIEALAICDIPSDNYLLIDTGWDNTGRVHAVVFHLRLVGDEIWLEVDGTTPGIAQELLEHGVEKEDIILGFYRPERRKIVDFSLA
ncbi:XisI protein [Lusitaniella coriacea LEGE 07157]|uniref:XisI protein n=1 Tax=Lusitaniella coriacea LEGE 07157 TaxID=945747 RepID=A0A8J7DVR1_9CYAN|nr:XisI protein [Lusitaniella coriacea]MBE9115989.1 XisI protein [Lusitaniella coriacea LEGE 07157]